MVEDDATEEGLTDFHPVYAIMTAPPVTSVPPDHLKAVTDKGGTTYDLGPLTDFLRAPVPEPEATPEEIESQKRMYLPNLYDPDAALKDYYDAKERQREQSEERPTYGWRLPKLW